MGFYGPGSDFTLDTTKPMTIVTQFVTADGTDDGDLVEIRRFYVQDGVKIGNSKSTLGHDSLTDETCVASTRLRPALKIAAAARGRASVASRPTIALTIVAASGATQASKSEGCLMIWSCFLRFVCGSHFRKVSHLNPCPFF